MGLIVGIGGTTRPGSATESALRIACSAAVSGGDNFEIFDGEYLTGLPFYGGPGWSEGSGVEMVGALRNCDGLIIASPGYHGTISGVLKNALDYIEELASDERVYLHDLPVGLIVTAHGYQAATSAMITLRTIVHALRGWPTPFGAALKIEPESFDDDGKCTDPAMLEQLVMVGSQVRNVITRTP